MQVFTEFTQGSADGWGMEHRPGTRQCGIHVFIGGLTRPPGVQQRFCQIPVGMAAGGEGFANAGGPKAQPNRAMLAKCVRKFSETPVFLGRDERAGTMAPEPAVMSCPRNRYTALAQSAVASPPLSSAAGGSVPDPEESRQPLPSAH